MSRFPERLWCWARGHRWLHQLDGCDRCGITGAELYVRGPEYEAGYWAGYWAGAESDSESFLDFTREIEDALPSTFYADLPLPARVKNLADAWRAAIAELNGSDVDVFVVRPTRGEHGNP